MRFYLSLPTFSLRWTAMLLAWSFLSSAVQAQNSLLPLGLSGFNADVIADGTYQDASSVQQSTSGPIDSVNVYYTKGFNPAFPSAGLAAGNTFVSRSNPNTTFLFQPATNNNALLLGDQSSGISSGTLNLIYPGSFTTLGILVTGLDSSNPVSYTLNFADNQAGVQGSFVAPDNFVGAGAVALNGFGRVSRDDGAFDKDAQQHRNPRLYEVDIALSATDAKRRLVSVTFSNLSSRLTSNGVNRKIAIFGISGYSNNVQARLIPMALSGYNQDVIADGGSAARDSTSVAIDGVNAFYALGFNTTVVLSSLPA
jgi:hypothetical protein